MREEDGYKTVMKLNEMFDIEVSAEEAIELEQWMFAKLTKEVRSLDAGWHEDNLIIKEFKNCYYYKLDEMVIVEVEHITSDLIVYTICGSCEKYVDENYDSSNFLKL